jgi:hypothetical protein
MFMFISFHVQVNVKHNSTDKRTKLNLMAMQYVDWGWVERNQFANRMFELIN